MTKIKNQKIKKTFPIFLLLPIVFLLGCTFYNPPKYVCDCRIWCKSFTYGETEAQYTAGNNTIENTKEDCRRYAPIACGGEENIINYTCNPVTWEEWNKIKEKERQSSGRMP